MPATTLPPVPHYESASVTQEDIDWADFPIIDISKSSTPEGRAELAPIVRDAMRTYGFIYVVNHGLTQAQNDRMVDIADIPFSQVSEDDKRQYASKIKETGSYRGFKPRQFWTIDNGVKDQIEHYNMHHSIVEQQHPKELQPFVPEIRAFAEHCHYRVLHPILRLLALGLELPEETFVKLHNFDAEGETYLRFMKYFPRTEEDESKTKNVWMKGHTDIGTISLLWCQPVTALQIMSPDGKWRYVKQIPNAIIANVGDSMEWLSGGYYKATIHRVFQPPADQRGYCRLGLLYFASGDDEVRIVPMKDSPVLKRVGITRKFADEDAPTMGEWRRARTKVYGIPELLQRKDNVIEEQIVNGLVVKHYN
ncbi:Clavaminate synthase-like protein [Dichomitus squalens LYAD-421 SS1]|uniref:Clavaminate synthase-like protein n=1 Tax=Dichomitus squalens (strain LYAD-421) TaxID=732165 RepID=R7SQ27_DICSQ|nr:Clavaminate synthase-like protein [Dichomitus squalens LYAD-421 SS1]EJF58284.1 Clavaminate synthase-like protein [Dichomitus squalens LYAD-421 SS1]